ncbi:restriction endonuclease subunit S [Streptococcus mitis]|uniref:restriction endonuclease subunit S n=1 Tax=Streptococcus mitis TaxID=28037 RepID=UPI0021B72550|nr:restriction endonuclease subunit S [Streptococcus mitis]
MNILEEIQNCSVEWKELGEVCSVKKGKQLNKNLLTEDGLYPAYNGGQTYSGRTNDYNVEANTIIVSQGGASAGFVNFVDTKFWANAHCYYILTDETRVNNRFVYHFVKMNQKYLMDFQHGAGIPALKSDKLSKLLIPIPPLEIQEKIVQILDKMTEYVTELTSELTSRKKQYSFYRDKLLSFEDEVYQVEWKTLGEVATVTKLAGYEFTKYVNYSSSGKIIALRGLNVKKGRLVLDDVKYIDNSEFSKLNRSKLQIDDMLFTYVGTVGEVALIDKDDTYYLAPNVAMVRLNTNAIIAKYLMYYCQSNAFVYSQIERLMEASSMKNLTMEKIRQFKIPVPSLEIQSRIVQVLDNFDTVCNDLNIGLPKEIELRQKQYEYFREKLLTFVAEGEYTESRVEEWDNSAIIKLLQWVFGPIRVELGTICEFVRGNGLQKKDFTEIGKSVIHYGQIYTKYDFTVTETLSKTSEIVFKKLKKAYPNDLVMATTSENVEDVGKAIVWEGKEEIGISGDSYIIQTSQNSRYLNYWFRSTYFQSQKERKVTGTKVVRINSKDMEKFKIVLPPITEQKRIVSILDNFNTLTSSLSEGLPKEIELRQKQYEYWRNQLLNFNE